MASPQLLSTGFFHADPHPGNLMRTPSGQLAIVDFGLMTVVSEEMKYTLLEAAVNLYHRNFPALVEDMKALGFTSSRTEMRAMEVTPPF
jgi:predicted unusual protein kinase regulating ubiquinone biosynthesis (AarF/ABC1/UbiB family)